MHSLIFADNHTKNARSGRLNLCSDSYCGYCLPKRVAKLTKAVAYISHNFPLKLATLIHLSDTSGLRKSMDKVIRRKAFSPLKSAYNLKCLADIEPHRAGDLHAHILCRLDQDTPEIMALLHDYFLAVMIDLQDTGCLSLPVAENTVNIIDFHNGGITAGRKNYLLKNFVAQDISLRARALNLNNGGLYLFYQNGFFDGPKDKRAREMKSINLSIRAEFARVLGGKHYLPEKFLPRGMYGGYRLWGAGMVLRQLQSLARLTYTMAPRYNAASNLVVSLRNALLHEDEIKENNLDLTLALTRAQKILEIHNESWIIWQNLFPDDDGSMFSQITPLTFTVSAWKTFHLRLKRFHRLYRDNRAIINAVLERLQSLSRPHDEIVDAFTAILQEIIGDSLFTESFISYAHIVYSASFLTSPPITPRLQLLFYLFATHSPPPLIGDFPHNHPPPLNTLPLDFQKLLTPPYPTTPKKGD